MALLRLPNELLLHVTSFLVTQEDINSFARATTRSTMFSMSIFIGITPLFFGLPKMDRRQQLRSR